jgi:hypothetical protein
VTLTARWVTLTARWVTLTARWVTLTACWVTFTAAALPYLDGDYWPGSADEHLMQMDMEARGGKAKASKAKG